jgi:hypothetical protein
MNVLEAVTKSMRCGMADLVDVRRHLPGMTREAQDTELNLLRRAGVLTGGNYEQRKKITPEQRAAQLDAVTGYVMYRD